MTPRLATFDNSQFIVNNMAGENFLVIMSTVFASPEGRMQAEKNNCRTPYEHAVLRIQIVIQIDIQIDPTQLRGKCKQKKMFTSPKHHYSLARSFIQSKYFLYRLLNDLF